MVDNDIWEGYPLCVVCGKPTQSWCPECRAIVCMRCNCPNWPMEMKDHPSITPETSEGEKQ